jgi:hypothetical protein
MRTHGLAVAALAAIVSPVLIPAHYIRYAALACDGVHWSAMVAPSVLVVALAS